MPSTSIRPASPDDAPGIARLRVDSWRATHRGMIPDAYLDGMSVDESAAQWHRVLAAGPNRTNTFVAETDRALSGFSSGLMLPEPKLDFDAELTGIYVV